MERRILKESDTDLIAQFFTLFHSTFELETRETDEQIWDELRGAYRLPVQILAFVDDSRLMGFARFSLLSGMNGVWLIHLAVDPVCRGRGLGSEMLRFEVDRPVFVEVDAGSRVEAWYRRMGYSLVCADYVQPALHPTTEPVPLLLMCSEPAEDLRQATLDFYREAWGLDAGSELVKRAVPRRTEKSD